MNQTKRNRRQAIQGLLAGVSGLFLSGCDRLLETKWFPKVLATGETLNRSVHQLFSHRISMAQEFSEADLSPTFRGNGNIAVDDVRYRAMAQSGFTDWQLRVDGLVDNPSNFSLGDLRALPSRTQITRHDCVEGWSAIGKWTGVPLSVLLEKVKPQATAKYVVFHCADTFGSGSATVPYYESIDLDDAFHFQTLLAYALNGQTLPLQNGAPLRLRVERQLGYKQAKFIKRIELVDSFAKIGGGNGGFWEDRGGYQWYAGI